MVRAAGGLAARAACPRLARVPRQRAVPSTPSLVQPLRWEQILGALTRPSALGAALCGRRTVEPQSLCAAGTWPERTAPRLGPVSLFPVADSLVSSCGLGIRPGSSRQGFTTGPDALENSPAQSRLGAIDQYVPSGTADAAAGPNGRGLALFVDRADGSGGNEDRNRQRATSFTRRRARTPSFVASTNGRVGGLSGPEDLWAATPCSILQRSHPAGSPSLNR